MVIPTIVIGLIGAAVAIATVLAVMGIGRLEEEQPSDDRGEQAFSSFDPLASEDHSGGAKEDR